MRKELQQKRWPGNIQRTLFSPSVACMYTFFLPRSHLLSLSLRHSIAFWVYEQTPLLPLHLLPRLNDPKARKTEIK